MSNGSGFAYVGIKDIRPDGSLDFENSRRVNESAVAKQERAFTIAEGDILFCRVATLGYPRRVRPSGRFALSATLALIKPGDSVDARFLHYALESDITRHSINLECTGSTRQAIGIQVLRRFPVPQPPLPVQRAIADYLDRETVRIDALIAAKRRMVKLLEEKRSELATHLLLGPPLAGRAAGPGQVTLRPGWSLIPFRRLFREIDVRSATGSETLLSVSQTRGVIPQSALGDRRQYADTLVGYKTCMSRDLVVNRMWVYYGALGAASIPGIVSPDYAVFRPTGEMSSEFAAYVLRTPAYVGEMTRLVRGIGAAFQGTVRKPRLHPTELGLIQMPMSSRSDQESLLRALDEQTAAITYRTSLLDRSLHLLLERRQALITAAITGHLDLPEAA